MKKLPIILSLLCISYAMTSCKDEVIVPVEKTATADSLVAKIGEQQDQIISVNTELNEIRITNANLQKTRDSLNAYYTTKVFYTVNVMSFGNSVLSNGRTSGLSGATVTVDQNGTKQTLATEGGTATFEVLNGNASVTVSAADHGTVEYSVYLGYSYNEDVRHASNQIYLFPKAGSAGAATISGSVFMNKSTLDDTLGRIYGTGLSVPEALRGTYVSKPGRWEHYNFTQYNSNQETSTIYGDPLPNQIAFDKAPSTLTVYAYPSIPSYAPNNNTDDGYINSITYKDVISSAKIDADGKFTLPVFASAEGMNVQLTTDTYYGSHTRLTWGDGTSNELGSQSMDFKSYDVNNNIATTISKRVITENNWTYRTYFAIPGDYFSTSISHTVRANQNLTQNIYLFPNRKN